MSIGSFSQGFDQVPRRSAEAFVGQVTEDSQLRRYESGVNAAPQAAEVWTITVDSDPGAQADQVITFNFGNGLCNVSFDIDGADAVADIAAKIAAAINAEPIVYGRVQASAAAAVVTVTARNTGRSFSVTDALAYTTLVNTVDSATADDIPVGRAVVYTGVLASNPISGTEADFLVALASTNRFTAQVITLTVDNGAAGDRAVKLYEVRGTERILIGQSAYAGNATEATEATALRNAINAAAPANSVLAAGTGADVTLTAEIDGLEFDVEVEAVGTSKALTTGPSQQTSLARAWAGVATYTLSDEAASIGGLDGRYPANAGVRYLKEGTIAVESSESLPIGGTVYVELAPGDNAGKLYAASSATRVAVGRNVGSWLRRTRDGLDLGIANLTYQGR